MDKKNGMLFHMAITFHYTDAVRAPLTAVGRPPHIKHTALSHA